MCGRTSLFAPPEELETRFDATVPQAYEPRYNIAPTEPLEVITNEDTAAIDRFRWGLIPEWADDDAEGFINARAESAHEKPAFRDAWDSRPCLVLSSGFYDWAEVARGPKRPYRFYRQDTVEQSSTSSRSQARGDGVAFTMAGLWERRDGIGETVTILTTEPNDVVEPIHDRMPVVLPPDEESTWLTAGPDERQELCRPYPGDDLDAYPISAAVNDPGNEAATIVEPDDTEQSGLGEFV